MDWLLVRRSTIEVIVRRRCIFLCVSTSDVAERSTNRLKNFLSHDSAKQRAGTQPGRGRAKGGGAPLLPSEFVTFELK